MDTKITFKHIRKVDVLIALQRLEKFGIENLNRSSGYDLYYEGKRFPPKEVVREAYHIVGGYENLALSGGDHANNILIRLGFTIVLKDTLEKIELNHVSGKKKTTPLHSVELTLRDDNALQPAQIESKTLTKTEKDQVIKARIGQSTFKASLIAVDPTCKICGLRHQKLLIASHIKPWCASTNEERLDVHNGFLLCPNHDALFDKGLISFDEHGQIIISTQIDDASRNLLNIHPAIKISLTKQQRAYLAWHRAYKLIDNVR